MHKIIDDPFLIFFDTANTSLYPKIYDRLLLYYYIIILLYDFKIDVGILDYGFEIDGILGMDFLLEANAIIDLKKKVILF